MKYPLQFVYFLMHIFRQKKLLMTLIKNDLHQNYLGSHLGMLWAFIQPLGMILVLWFVFAVGFRIAAIDNSVPFVIWLMGGMVPWLYFSEAWSGATQSVTANSFLVKKVNFRVSVLPIVKIVSSLFVHLIFVAILVCILLFYGFTPTLYWLQLFYYLACTLLLLLGLSWLTASMMVFAKDVGQFVALLLQMGFWATPVFWNISMVPQEYQYIVKLNPMFYIVEGYRDALYAQVWFWEKGSLTLYFFGFTAFVLIAGALVFKRLRPHFADVL